MKYYPSMSYWDAYLLPVPIRRWLIEESNRQAEHEEKQTPGHKIIRPATVPLRNMSNPTQPMQPAKK